MAIPCGVCTGCCTSSYFIHLKPAFEAVQKASGFIIKYRDLFPQRFFPRNAPRQAVLAIRIHLEFKKRDSCEIKKNFQALVDLIVLKYEDHASDA